MIVIKLSDLDKRILSQVCLKSAVEITKANPIEGLTWVETAGQVDKIARLLYLQHIVWLSELCQPEPKQENEQSTP